MRRFLVELIHRLPGTPNGREIQLANQLPRQIKFLHADEARPKTVRLNNVGPGSQVLPMNLGDLLRVRDAQNVRKPNEILVMPGKAVAADLLLGQAVPLEHRAHRAVKDQDAVAEEVFELRKDFGAGERCHSGGCW